MFTVEQLIPRTMHLSCSIVNYSFRMTWERRLVHVCLYSLVGFNSRRWVYYYWLIFVDCAEYVTVIDDCFLQICCDVQRAGWEVVSDISERELQRFELSDHARQTCVNYLYSILYRDGLNAVHFTFKNHIDIPKKWQELTVGQFWKKIESAATGTYFKPVEVNQKIVSLAMLVPNELVVQFSHYGWWKNH
jgi:hypothetical protein